MMSHEIAIVMRAGSPSSPNPIYDTPSPTHSHQSGSIASTSFGGKIKLSRYTRPNIHRIDEEEEDERETEWYDRMRACAKRVYERVKVEEDRRTAARIRRNMKRRKDNREDHNRKVGKFFFVPSVICIGTGSFVAVMSSVHDLGYGTIVWKNKTVCKVIGTGLIVIGMLLFLISYILCKKRNTGNWRHGSMKSHLAVSAAETASVSFIQQNVRMSKTGSTLLSNSCNSFYSKSVVEFTTTTKSSASYKQAIKHPHSIHFSAGKLAGNNNKAPPEDTSLLCVMSPSFCDDEDILFIDEDESA